MSPSDGPQGDTGLYSVRLSFALVRCSCGGERVRGVACPDCNTGADWFETDNEWQRRDRMVKRALAVLNEPHADTEVGEVDYPTVFSDLADLTPRFFRALQRMAGQQGDDVTEMLAVCRDAMSLRATLQSAAAPRPWVLTGSTARTAAEGVVQVIRGFLCALSARTPLAAQRLAAEAQQQLDAVVAPVEEFNELHDRWDSVSDAEDVAQWLTASLLDAADAAGSPGLIGLDVVGRDAYASVTGRVPSEGAGLGLLIHQLNSRMLGDENKFNAALKAADGLISRNRSTFEQILERPEALAELRAGMLQLADQIAETNAVVANAVHERQGVRALVALMHTMFEGPGRRCAGLYLELVGKGVFEEYQTADGAETVHKAQQDKQLKGAFYGLNRALRIAHAHQSYTVHEDHLVLRERGRPGEGHKLTRMPLAEVLDHFLAATECLNALCLAAQAAALDVGVDLIGPEFLPAVGVGPAALLAAMLSADGYEDIVVDNAAEVARVTLTGGSLSTAAVSTISLTFPEHEVVSIGLQATDGTEEWVVNAAAVRSNAEMEDGIDKEMHFQDVLSAMTLDGQRCWTDEAVQGWVAGKAVQTLMAQPLTEAYPAVMRELRALVTFSRTRGFDDLANALKGIMRFLRLTAEGIGGDPEVFDALARYTSDESPPLPFTPVTT